MFSSQLFERGCDTACQGDVIVPEPESLSAWIFIVGICHLHNCKSFNFIFKMSLNQFISIITSPFLQETRRTADAPTVSCTQQIKSTYLPKVIKNWALNPNLNNEYFLSCFRNLWWIVVLNEEQREERTTKHLGRHYQSLSKKLTAKHCSLKQGCSICENGVAARSSHCCELSLEKEEWMEALQVSFREED